MQTCVHDWSFPTTGQPPPTALHPRSTHGLQVLLQILNVCLQPDLEDVEVLRIRAAQRLQKCLQPGGTGGAGVRQTHHVTMPDALVLCWFPSSPLTH